MIETKINIPHVPFYFIRHGQTDWNREHKVMGLTDIPLNEVGLKQAHVAAENIAHLDVSRIVSSPLKRAMQTAEIIAKAINKPITIIDELKQPGLGIMEGQHKSDDYNQRIERWKMGGDIEGAEDWADFVSRIAGALKSALASNPGEKPILMVAHGPVYWALLHILKAQAIDKDAKNCVVYFFRPPNGDSQQWVVHALSEKDINYANKKKSAVCKNEIDKIADKVIEKYEPVLRKLKKS